MTKALNWLKSFLSLKAVQLALTVVSAIATFVIGTVLEDTGPFMTVLLVIALFPLVILIGLWVLVSVGNTVQNLEKRVSIKVSYAERGRVDPFGKANEIIDSAEQKIIVCTSFIAPPEKPSKKEEKGVSKYYTNMLQNLIERAKANPRGDYEYTRILQFPEGKTDLKEVVDDLAYLRHFEEMLTCARPGNLKIHLRKVNASLHSTFVLVDNTKLIWQLNQVSKENKNKTKLHGVFLIDDPFQEITPIFRDHFSQIDRSSNHIQGGGVSIEEIREAIKAAENKQAAASNPTPQTTGAA